MNPSICRRIDLEITEPRNQNPERMNLKPTHPELRKDLEQPKVEGPSLSLLRNADTSCEELSQPLLDLEKWLFAYL